MAGGPSHIDTFDPKPDAPAEEQPEKKKKQAVVTPKPSRTSRPPAST